MPKAIRLGLGIVTLIGFAAGLEARAADMPALKAPMRSPAYDWTGFYIGVNGGGSAGRSGTDVVFDAPTRAGGVTETAVGSMSQSMVGALGGLQAGYNAQANSFVFGLEADIQATSQKGDALLPDSLILPSRCLGPCPPGTPLFTVTTSILDYAQKLPWFGTARARVGVTPADRWLVYATGGLAYGEIKTDATVTLPALGSATASSSQTKAGWVAGAGVEAALGGGWTGKVEYLHVDFGNVSSILASTLRHFDGTFIANSHVTDEILRVGVNYRFGGAVVAKY